MPENGGSERQKRTKIPFLCSGMVAASPIAPTGAHRLQLGTAAVHAAGNSTVHTAGELPQKATAEELPPCNLPPANLPAAHTAVALPPRSYRKKATAGTPVAVHAAKTYLPLIPPCIPPCIPPWRYRRGATAKSYSRGTTAVHAAGILPRDGSCAQRAGDSDVGANDKGAGDDPGDGVDAH